MNKFILTTPDELREILNECLSNLRPISSQLVESESPKYLYSLRELSEFLGCSIVTAQKLKNSGKIRYRQFGRKCVFNTAEVLEDISKKKKN